MSPTHAASLVNLTGFVAGTVLYAMLLVMVLRARSGQPDGRGGIDNLLVLTALLGLAWNTGAFVNYGLRDFGVAPMPRLAQAVAYAALGLLPAVVVHSVLRAGLTKLTSTVTLVLIAAAYPLSGAAMLIHIGSALRGGVVPAPAGLRLLTYGFTHLDEVAAHPPVAHDRRGRRYLDHQDQPHSRASCALQVEHSGRTAAGQSRRLPTEQLGPRVEVEHQPPAVRCGGVKAQGAGCVGHEALQSADDSPAPVFSGSHRPGGSETTAFGCHGSSTVCASGADSSTTSRR